MPLLEPTLPQGSTPVVKWGRLYGAAAALAIAEGAAQAHAPLIVIAQSSREAEALSDEIRFFAGGGFPVRVFPDLETLPYDGFSAHPDITSARLATLADMPPSRKWSHTANSRCAVRSSTSFPWDRTLPFESTCWTAMSTASAGSIRT